MTIGDFIRRITPPLNYTQDNMTNGPVLPEGWTGDAWIAGVDVPGYFLRAWNDQTGQVAIVQSGEKYEAAAAALRAKVEAGGDWVVTAERT